MTELEKAKIEAFDRIKMIMRNNDMPFELTQGQPIVDVTKMGLIKMELEIVRQKQNEHVRILQEEVMR